MPATEMCESTCFHLQDRELEIMPRLQKLICRVNEPDDDDVSLVSAPVYPKLHPPVHLPCICESQTKPCTLSTGVVCST